MLKILLVRAKKEIRSTVEKASMILEKTYIIRNRMFGGNMNVKGSSDEVSERMRNTLLETGRKVLLVT